MCAFVGALVDALVGPLVGQISLSPALCIAQKIPKVGKNSALALSPDRASKARDSEGSDSKIRQIQGTLNCSTSQCASTSG